MTDTLMSRRHLQRFRENAVAFVALVDSRANYSLVDWLTRVHARIAELYASALELQEVEPHTEDANEARMSHEDWSRVYQDLGEFLGRWNYYWDVYDPYSDSDREAVCGSLADDLADIYRDLRDGLSVLDTAHPDDVLWNWWFHFRIHWAAHATGALRALSTVFFVYEEELAATLTDAQKANSERAN